MGSASLRLNGVVTLVFEYQDADHLSSHSSEAYVGGLSDEGCRPQNEYHRRNFLSQCIAAVSARSPRILHIGGAFLRL